MARPRDFFGGMPSETGRGCHIGWTPGGEEWGREGVVKGVDLFVLFTRFLLGFQDWSILN